MKAAGETPVEASSRVPNAGNLPLPARSIARAGAGGASGDGRRRQRSV